MEQAIVSAVVHDTSEAKVTVARRARPAGHRGTRCSARWPTRDVNVDMIVQNVSDHGVTDISFTVPHDDLDAAIEVIARRSPPRSARPASPTDAGIGKVSLVGAGMKSNPGVAATMFETLADAGINIEMISTSAIRISCVDRRGRRRAGGQALHAAFGLDRRSRPASTMDCGPRDG